VFFPCFLKQLVNKLNSISDPVRKTNRSAYFFYLK